MAYQLVKDPRTGLTDQCIRYTDSTNVVKFIPYNEDNMDYIEYKAWLDAGNTPLAAD